ASSARASFPKTEKPAISASGSVDAAASRDGARRQQRSEEQKSAGDFIVRKRSPDQARLCGQAFNMSARCQRRAAVLHLAKARDLSSERDLPSEERRPAPEAIAG